MKAVGLLVTLLAACWIVYAQNMNISVETGYGQEVVNMSLMQRQAMFTNIGIGAAIIGVLIFLFGGKDNTSKTTLPPTEIAYKEHKPALETIKCPACKGYTKKYESKCQQCGEVF